MNVLHYQIDVCVIWIYSYSYNYLTRTLFVIGKMEKMRLKIRKIRKYAIDSEAWYHYAVGSIVTLVAILIGFVVAFKLFS